MQGTIVKVSTAAGHRIGLDSFYLAQRHLALLPLALALMFAVSLLTPIDSAATATGHPSTTTRSTRTRRPSGVRRALP